MRSRPLFLLLIASLLAGASAVRGEAVEDGEPLAPGAIRERPIASRETHVYRVEVGDDPLLITIEQHGIDLLLEARGPSGPVTATANDLRWGWEVLLLESAGEHRIEARPHEGSLLPGRYAIRVEALPESPEEARRAALSAMSRAGQEAALRTPEARRRAVALYREAQAAWRSLGEKRWEAEALSSRAALETSLSELRSAGDAALRALELWRELGEPAREASAWNELGIVRLFLWEIEAAREPLEKARFLWRQLGERRDEMETRVNLCYAELAGGALPAALSCYEETRGFFHEIGDRSQEAQILNSLGGVYDLLGEPDAALEHYGKALDLRRALGDRSGEAQSLNNLATVHRFLGDWQEALRFYAQAREILAPLGDRLQETAVLNNVGFTYNHLGEPQRALAFLEDALKLSRETGDRRGELAALNNLGLTWRNLGDPARALDWSRQALERALALGDGRQEAVSRMRLAEVHLERGDAAAALRELEPALAYLEEKGLRPAEIQALSLRGRALARSGRPREALPVFAEVVERRQALRDRAGEAEALLAWAAAERSLGLAAEARAHANAAVARVEELRAGLVSAELRAAFLATRRRAYSFLIELLMDLHAAEPGKGHDREAFAVSERARARTLLDALHAGSTGSPGGVLPAELAERRRSLLRRLNAKANQRLKQGPERAKALESEMEALLAGLDSVEAEIARHDPRFAALREPQPVEPQAAAALLDPETLLLEYSLGEERSFLWTVDSAGVLRSYLLPQAQKEIEDLSRQLYTELSRVESGSGRRPTTAEDLGRILLGPVWKDAARLKRLVVVPDGALHALPFAALQVPKPGLAWDVPGVRKPLLEFQEVVSIPSATTLAFQRQRLGRRAPAPRWAAILADPVFSSDDPRLTHLPAAPGASSTSRSPERGGPGDVRTPVFERLPASRQEAKDIAGLAPSGMVWTGLDFAASRESVLSGELRSYRVIHFATHGVADTRTPELSGLVLSLVDAAGHPRDGFLGVSDLYELELAADLVVLSGCRTALGKEVPGEGLMGLTRGFLYAGVPRVVASLWKVQDRTTAELMTLFYQAMWKQGLHPAAALREAQRTMRKDTRHRHPYSWAGFVLQGDWR